MSAGGSSPEQIRCNAGELIHDSDSDGERPAKRPRMDVVAVGDFVVDPIGLGTMPLGIEYPHPAQRPSRVAAISMLHEAFRSGVQMLDTADSYCAGPGGSAEAAAPHYVERIIGEALRTFEGDASRIRVCTKGGFCRINNKSNGWRPASTSRSHVQRMIAKSHEALGGARPIDVFMLHHADGLSTGQLEGALAAMQEAVNEGKVLCLGLANATIEHLKLAQDLGCRISAVENAFSLWQREAELERPLGAAVTSKKGVLRWCAEKGVAFMPYGVLGGVQHRDGRRSLRESFPRLVELADARRRT